MNMKRAIIVIWKQCSTCALDKIEFVEFPLPTDFNFLLLLNLYIHGKIGSAYSDSTVFLSIQKGARINHITVPRIISCLAESGSIEFDITKKEGIKVKHNPVKDRIFARSFKILVFIIFAVFLVKMTGDKINK